MNYPKITIMIPTYNQAKYIEECVASALSMNYQNFEVVVSDDNSKDETPNLMEKFKKYQNFRYSRNSQNIGRVKNYQKLLYELASGEWVVNLDGDDYYTDKSFLLDAIDQLYTCKEPDSIVLIGAGQKISFANGTCKSYDVARNVSVKNGFDVFLTWAEKGPPHLASLYRKKQAIDISFYDKDIISCDRESMLRLVLHGSVLLLNKNVGVWRKHEENSSNSIKIKDLENDLVAIEYPYILALKMKHNKKALDKWHKKSIKEIFVLYIVKTMQIAALPDVTPIKRKKINHEIFMVDNLLNEKYPHIKKPFFYILRIYMYLMLGARNFQKIRVGYIRIKNVVCQYKSIFYDKNIE